MRAFSVLTPALAVLALSFVACDSKSDTATTTQPSSTQDNTPSGNIDLSGFTPVTVPKSWSLVEDWMVPKFGVVTGAIEGQKDWLYSLRVSGVTTADVESYRSVLVKQGMTEWTEMESSGNYVYRNDKMTVSFEVGTTSMSIMIRRMLWNST